jgi:hypothetical protein
MRSELFEKAFFSILVCLLTGCAEQNSTLAPTPSASNSSILITAPSKNAGATNHIQKITSAYQYDDAFVKKISQKWWDLLDARKFAPDRTGKVVVYFILHSDGSISDMKLLSNNAGATPADFSEDAILDCVPFPKWSPDMVKKLGDHTEVKFIFDYYGK